MLCPTCVQAYVTIATLVAGSTGGVATLVMTKLKKLRQLPVGGGRETLCI
jgi:hypothetical protein